MYIPEELPWHWSWQKRLQQLLGMMAQFVPKSFAKWMQRWFLETSRLRPRLVRSFDSSPRPSIRPLYWRKLRSEKKILYFWKTNNVLRFWINYLLGTLVPNSYSQRRKTIYSPHQCQWGLECKWVLQLRYRTMDKNKYAIIIFWSFESICFWSLDLPGANSCGRLLNSWQKQWIWHLTKLIQIQPWLPKNTSNHDKSLQKW